MSKYLILITIGPVQEFIAAARRTRDLWFGSWLLSQLSRAAAQKVFELQGTLIFPHREVITASPEKNTSAQQSANVANKIVASITTKNIGETGEAIQKAVQKRLTELRDDAFNSIKVWTQGDRVLAEQQVDALIECYWVAVPFTESLKYKTQRDLLENLMAARKSIRHFTQIQLSEVEQPEHNQIKLSKEQQRYPKSSLDGQRESVILESAYPNRDDPPQARQTKLLTLFRTFGAKQAERLSGVDLLKRRGNYKADEADFPSTSHFAALPFLQHLADTYGADKIHSLFNHYRKTLEDLIANNKMIQLEKLDERYREPFGVIGNYDASILYMSRLAEGIDTKDIETRSSAERALRDFLSLAANGAEPGAYYAILQADGDSMGTVIDNQLEIKDHQKLSRQLATFAKKAEEIVLNNRGALVYAGGDDVLALLPVDTVLQCAKDLHDRFDALVGTGYCCDTCGKPRFVTTTGLSPTLSVGIAICHHLEPLNDALALVRSAEKSAKQVQGKNGLAIVIAKRSGEPQRIQGSWAEDKGFFTRLQTWLRLMQHTELSAGAPYELRNLVERLGEPQELNTEAQTLHRAIAEEAGRIIERKQGQRGSKKLDTKDITELRTLLGLPEKKSINGNIVFVPTDNGERYGKQMVTVRQLADELIVARELVRLGATELQERNKQ